MRLLTDHEGRSFRLTDERLAHLLEHPEMAGLESQIAETLSRPELVIQSNVDETVRLYYRRYRGTLVGDKYLCVVAKAVMSDAFVLTVF